MTLPPEYSPFVRRVIHQHHHALQMVVIELHTGLLFASVWHNGNHVPDDFAANYVREYYGHRAVTIVREVKS